MSPELRPVPITHKFIDLRKGYSNQKLCQWLVDEHNEPYLVFCSTKRFTIDRAMEMCNHLSGTKNDEKEIVKNVRQLISREEIPELEKILCSCLVKGVGFHHSDLHNNLRRYVADLFINRQIDYLFCTTGLAYGINFPAKAVVIADLSLWDFEAGRSNPIPIYLYLQMAGRAGRPQYDDKGFCYVIARKDDDVIKFQEYVKGDLRRATSQIRHDEYFRKAILELVYSQRNTDEEIISFFENSLFHLQATKQENALTSHDLRKLIETRIRYLDEAGFLERLGINFQLTDFGKVTLDYLFRGFSSPELSAFIRLRQYLERTGSVKTDFDIVYFLSKNFPDCRISKQPHQKSKDVEEFLEGRSIVDRTNQEYSAYVVFHKWIENVDEAQIDKDCKVYSSNLPSKMWEMYKLLCVYEELARTKHFQIPDEFQVFKERIRYGVRGDELPLVKIHGIGRETAGSIRRYCYSVLRTNFGYTGTPLDILQTLLEKQGEEKFRDIHIKHVKYVGDAKARRLLSFVKKTLDKKKQ
jgi:helicase